MICRLGVISYVCAKSQCRSMAVRALQGQWQLGLLGLEKVSLEINGEY